MMERDDEGDRREDAVCVCGHEKDDHLARLSVTGDVYGPCRVTTDKWNPCTCAEYEPDEGEVFGSSDGGES